MVNLKEATFAGGCFWGVENSFMQLDGIMETTVGYMGGKFVNPTYFDVCSGLTGHAEVVNVKYDEGELDFRNLCLFFFDIHNPTTRDRQGPDVGPQYRSSIFYHDEFQRKIADEIIEELNAKSNTTLKVVTEVVPAMAYYIAEDCHQKYILRNNLESCGGNI